MAKQTFTTGQVLTAAQMTSLQQTAMGGGSATTKTASYTLVAADAGTTITMTSVSATTITVNTSLFAAGDTVYIQNLGAGVSTITAGTATVSTSATLALAQYEGGQLYFNSTSAAIFIKGAGAAASGGDNFTLLNSGGTSLSGTSTSITGISGQDKLLILVKGASHGSAFDYSLEIQFNTNTGSVYTYQGFQIVGQASSLTPNSLTGINTTTTAIVPASSSANASSVASAFCLITGCNSAGVKAFTASGGADRVSTSTDNKLNSIGGIFDSSATISSVQIKFGGGTFDAGTVFIYGSA